MGAVCDPLHAAWPKKARFAQIVRAFVLTAPGNVNLPLEGKVKARALSCPALSSFKLFILSNMQESRYRATRYMVY